MDCLLVQYGLVISIPFLPLSFLIPLPTFLGPTHLQYLSHSLLALWAFPGQPTFCPSRHWLSWIDRPPPSSSYPWLHSHSPTATCFVPVFSYTSSHPTDQSSLFICLWFPPIIHSSIQYHYSHCLSCPSTVHYCSFPCKSSHHNIKLNPCVIEVIPYPNKTTNTNNMELKYDHMFQQYQKPSMALLVDGLAENCCCILHSLLF